MNSRLPIWASWRRLASPTYQNSPYPRVGVFRYVNLGRPQSSVWKPCSREGLIWATDAWVLHKQKALGELLVRRGELALRLNECCSKDFSMIGGGHAGDAARSLRAFSSGGVLSRTCTISLIVKFRPVCGFYGVVSRSSQQKTPRRLEAHAV